MQVDLVLRTAPRPRAARPQDKHLAARRDPRHLRGPGSGGEARAALRTSDEGPLGDVRLPPIPRVAITGSAVAGSCSAWGS